MQQKYTVTGRHFVDELRIIVPELQIIIFIPWAYCIKRIFPARKTSETKQMLIRFFGLKKGLFPLF